MEETELETLCNSRPKVGIRAYRIGMAESGPLWWCLLTYRRRRLSTEYRAPCWFAGPPTAADVVYRLLQDSRARHMSFEEWCVESDHNPDSRAAERLYNRCCQSGPKLRRFLGDDFNRFAAAEHRKA